MLQSNLPGIPVRRGKVRDVYDFGERLLLVASDRISAFDHVLPTPIPDKGRVLTKISEYWFGKLNLPHHLLSMEPSDLPLPAAVNVDDLRGRSMVVRKTKVVPIECVVRGFLTGSGLKEYKKTDEVCGIKLPAGLQESSRLPEPIFTPATKEETGHDVNISFERMCEIVGRPLSEELRKRSLDIYRRGVSLAQEKGILIADTKFEFGQVDGEVLLIDEVLTPDSSRFWPRDAYAEGKSQASFDKQFVRDWLETSGWDKESTPPALPDDVVRKTRAKYIEAYERLSGETFAWK